MLSGADASRSTSMPGSIVRAACRLRTKRPAVISSSSESATSATTSPFFRSSLPPRSGCALSPPLSAGTSPGRDASSAGATPNRMPVTHDSSSAKRRTRWSMAKSTASGRAPAGGGAALKPPMIAQASRTPATPPSRDNRTLSVSSWRMRRARLAPRASRTAISRRRAAALDSSRFAIFAQAISSTAPTAPPSRKATERICCRWAAFASSMGRVVTWSTGAGCEDPCARCRRYSAITASRSAAACAALTPRWRWPTPKIQLLVGFLRRSGFCSPE